MPRSTQSSSVRTSAARSEMGPAIFDLPMHSLEAAGIVGSWLKHTPEKALPLPSDVPAHGPR